VELREALITEAAGPTDPTSKCCLLLRYCSHHCQTIIIVGDLFSSAGDRRQSWCLQWPALKHYICC